MKKICCCLVALCLYGGMSSVASAVEFGIDLPVNSKYMWRGLELNEDSVFQPEAWVKYKSLSLRVWSNMELTDVHNGHGENGDSGDFTQVNYILQYENSIDKIKFNGGYIYYDYPHTSYPGTWELFGSIGFDMLLSPTLTVYRDFKEADGWYSTFGLSHAIELNQFLNSTLNLSGNIAFSSENHTKYYYGKDTNTFTNSLLSAGLKIPITDAIAIVPTVNYSALLGSMRDEGLNKRNDTFWCGIKVSCSFDTVK
jgi:hypothetical protein